MANENVMDLFTKRVNECKNEKVKVAETKKTTDKEKLKNLLDQFKQYVIVALKGGTINKITLNDDGSLVFYAKEPNCVEWIDSFNLLFKNADKIDGIKLIHEYDCYSSDKDKKFIGHIKSFGFFIDKSLLATVTLTTGKGIVERKFTIRNVGNKSDSKTVTEKKEQELKQCLEDFFSAFGEEAEALVYKHLIDAIVLERAEQPTDDEIEHAKMLALKVKPIIERFENFYKDRNISPKYTYITFVKMIDEISKLSK